MIDCISVENMRLSDAFTIANLVPSLELMYRAAFGVYKAVSWKNNTAIVVGSGNNGGDGFALACILKDQKKQCTVFTLSDRLSPDSAYYAEQAKAAGVEVRSFETGCLVGFNIVVDCLLGTGFQGSVRDSYRLAIEEINSCGVQVVSVDINSGMNGDSGEAEVAVRSDLTVTIGFVKNGLISDYAGRYMKRLVCADIGIRLLREENKICSREEYHSCSTDERERADSVRYYPCPDWLDMNILKTY